VFNHPNFADPNIGVFVDGAGDRDPTSGLITSNRNHIKTIAVGGEVYLLSVSREEDFGPGRPVS